MNRSPHAFERGTQVQAAVAPARGPDRVADVRTDDGRPAVLLREPGRDQPDDADGPRAADQRRRRGCGLVDQARASVSTTLTRSRRSRFAASRASACDRGLLGRSGEQQSRGHDRLPHPAGRVESRREGERDRLEIGRRRVDARPRQECGDAGPRGVAQALEAQPGDGPVLADDRRHVGDGPDGREIGQGEGRGGTAGQVREQRLRDLEGDTAAGEALVRVAANRGGAD